MAATDSELVEVFLTPIRKCADYRPAFGQGRAEGVDLPSFRSLYGTDPFYAWLGLDDPLVYAAHKAAGGLTSVYRQIGVGAERLLRAIIRSAFQLSEEQVSWRYEYDKPDGTKAQHMLDVQIALSDLRDPGKARFAEWLLAVRKRVALPHAKRSQMTGAVFEVRQGYKSADSKRQNADLRFGIRAYQAGLLPVFMVLSSQISEPVVHRYRSDGMLVLTGTLLENPESSTFAFFRDVVDYDLASFLQRNSDLLRREMKAILEALLSAQ